MKDYMRTGSGVDNPTGRVAEVEWEDSQGRSGWQGEPLRLPIKGHIKSVGYVLQDDDAAVVLMLSYDGQEDRDGEKTYRWGSSIGIPRSAIRKVKYLRGR